MTEVAKKFMTISLWVAIVVFVLRCWIGWNDITTAIEGKKVFACGYSIFGYAGESIGIAAAIIYFYNKYLWKYFNVYKVPVLAKHYEGELIYTWNDEMGNRDVTIDIEQTFLSVKVLMKTNESTSDSINASITYINDVPYLQYLYLNKPDPNIREVSSIHYGHASFKLNDTDCLMGEYFTDRKTTGRIEVKAI